MLSSSPLLQPQRMKSLKYQMRMKMMMMTMLVRRKCPQSNQPRKSRRFKSVRSGIRDVYIRPLYVLYNIRYHVLLWDIMEGGEEFNGILYCQIVLLQMLNRKVEASVQARSVNFYFMLKMFILVNTVTYVYVSNRQQQTSGSVSVGRHRNSQSCHHCALKWGTSPQDYSTCTTPITLYHYSENPVSRHLPLGKAPALTSTDFPLIMRWFVWTFISFFCFLFFCLGNQGF